jgi:hypothetical protein
MVGDILEMMVCCFAKESSKNRETLSRASLKHQQPHCYGAMLVMNPILSRKIMLLRVGSYWPNSLIWTPKLHMIGNNTSGVGDSVEKGYGLPLWVVPPRSNAAYGAQAGEKQPLAATRLGVRFNNLNYGLSFI